MQNIAIYFVALPEPVREVAEAAGRQAFPSAQTQWVKSVTEALQAISTPTAHLLVLSDLAEDEIALAAQALDEQGKPRCGMIVLGERTSSLASSVPADKRGLPWLALLFQSIMLEHELIKENLQLRGDLQTLARRLGHDLRSPLNCLHLNCEVMQEILPPDASLARNQLQSMRRSLSEIDQLVERFSFILRASTNPLPLNDVAMGAVIRRVVESLGESIATKGIELNCATDWPQIRGVPLWLESIWSNLIGNALKHSLPSAPVQLGWSEDQEFLKFWVANQGAPVPKEQEARLFLNFGQLHTQTIHGLGLALVQRLVSLQGGRCGYERRADEWSVFYFTLPTVDALSPAR